MSKKIPLHRKKKSENSKTPLFYLEIDHLIKQSYNKSLFRKMDDTMRIWLRARLSLFYTLFVKGDDLINITFDCLQIGMDDNGDPCLLLKFFERKSFTAYKNMPPVLYIPPNTEEPALNCFKFVSEY